MWYTYVCLLNIHKRRLPSKPAIVRMGAHFVTMLLLFLTLVFIIQTRRRSKKHTDRLPPGSMGLPLIGQSFDLLAALKADKVERWFNDRICKYGPIWKAHVFGYPTVVLNGVSANKFVYTNTSALTNSQPPSMARLFGLKNILELTGHDHKRVRGAMVSFLKIQVLKQYVAKADEEVKTTFRSTGMVKTLSRSPNFQTSLWIRRYAIMKDVYLEIQKVQPLMKNLTFNVICSLIFGMERGPRREELLQNFEDLIASVLAIPINFPFSQFNRGLKARKKLVKMIENLVSEKRKAMKEENIDKDIITSLLNIHVDGDSSTVMSDEEIIDNVVLVMVAGYDTTSVLLSFFLQHLANNQSIYSKVYEEQEAIARNKASHEALTWEDLTKMKYTWRVASEVLRINTPAVLTFRRAAQDIEYGGYIIPKGWQVMWSACMTHMDDSIFQDPATFDPDRFQDAAATPPFSLLAFGAGPRICPGMELAKMEALVFIHRLVTQFKWELVNKDEPFTRIPMPEFHQGLQVRISPIKETILTSYN